MAENVIFETENAQAIIPKVQKLLAKYKFVCTDSHIYLISKGAGAFGQILGSQFGCLGAMIAGAFTNKKLKNKADELEGKTIDQIVEIDEKSIKFPYTEIEKFQIKKGFFGGTAQGLYPIFLWTPLGKIVLNFYQMDLDEAEKILESKCPGKKK